jgi:hypothetical protein
MKYLKNRNKFKESLESKPTKLIENVNYHKTHVKNLGEVQLPDPEFGDFKLSVMPFENNGKWVSLPEGFKRWEESFNQVIKKIPLQEGANTHYVTIDTKFFTTDEFLRREGVHIDGNFCVDPKFKKMNEATVDDILSDDYLKGVEDEFKASWGGAEPKPSWGGATYKASWGGAEPKPSWGGARYKDESKDFKASWGGATWGGARYEYTDAKYEEKADNSHVKMDWVLPYKDIIIPIADYVSESKGGILTVSTEVGCQAWDGEFYGEILGEGAFTEMEDQLTDDRKKVFEKNQLYFMSSNTPHETLLITKGKRRTFLRITLNHNYENKAITI